VVGGGGGGEEEVRGKWEGKLGGDGGRLSGIDARSAKRRGWGAGWRRGRGWRGGGGGGGGGGRGVEAGGRVEWG